MILIAMCFNGKIFATTSFQSKEVPFFDVKRALQKGNFALLLKVAGVQTPRTPLVARLPFEC